MVKGILKNLATIIFCVILSIVIGVPTIPSFVSEINKEISGENRQESMEFLDKKTKRIEDKGLTLEELTNSEEVDSSNLSKSEIDGYYVFNFKHGRYEVNIYFDSEENIVSIQKDYPEGYDGVYVISIVFLLILFPGTFCIIALLGIGVCIYNIKEIVDEHTVMKKYKEERKQDIKE